MTTRTDPSPGKPLRVSKVAIYGIPIEKEFTRTSAPILSVSIVQDRKAEHTCALVDSGCEGYAFIDREYAKSVGLLMYPVPRPFSLYGYDGEERDSRIVCEYVRCDIKNGDHVDKDVVLYATPLSHYPIVLGHPWLKKHNPRANWADGSWEFSDPYCLQNCNVTRHPTRQKTLKGVPKRYIPELKHRDIAQVSMNACKGYARRGYQMFMATIEDIDASLQQESEELKLQLPEALSDFADVFSPKKADKLPPHRPYDHEIRLTSDKKLPFGRIYSMSREELRTLRDWLDENLRKGFIRPSSSPVTSPVLFVKKDHPTHQLLPANFHFGELYRHEGAVGQPSRIGWMRPEKTHRLFGSRLAQQIARHVSYDTEYGFELPCKVDSLATSPVTRTQGHPRMPQRMQR